MVVAIVPAAGLGTRLNAPLPKQFLPLRNRPLIVRTLQAIENVPEITAAVVAIPEGYAAQLRHLCSEYQLSKVRRIVVGGATRQDSVAQALQAEEVRQAAYVVIHDAVRPLAPCWLFQRVLEAARQYGAAVPGLAPTDTVKEITANGIICRTLQRERLRLIQTPQAFRRELLEQAYRAAAQCGWEGTDDAALVEALGHAVAVVEGAPENIKITYPLDLIVAEHLLEQA